MHRRHFCLSLLSGLGGSLMPATPGPDPRPAGELLGPSFLTGHQLRGKDWPSPTEHRAIPLLIVGGGIAGLCAAWWLKRNGFESFRLLELEQQPGGNARWGENPISAYPWGAHYLPLPGVELPWVRRLLADLGVLLGDPAAPEPRYDERHLCFAPQERLFLHGAWQEGLLPKRGVARRDLDQYQRFAEAMRGYRDTVGKDGRRAFTLPMAQSSRDPRFLALDQGSMRDWLLAQGYDSPYLHWYVDYACRDDFGCSAADTSAWAGLHYFASRTGSAEAARDGAVLTWPEGNGWIVRRLLERLDPWIERGQMAFRMKETDSGVTVDAWNPASQTATRWQAAHVVWAAPSFLLPHVCPDWPEASRRALAGFDYAPWLVANLSLHDVPESRHGAPLAWDNVLYQSPSLGYVVATHQHWRSRERGTVLTYYRPFSELAPAQGRKLLSNRSGYDWTAAILADLARPHPDIRELTERVDLFRWGHAMARPRPGFLWDGGRELVAEGSGRIHPAHSDLSGFSLFEEAQYRGIVAAQAALAGVS
ncbi:NAD(P)-binding Rossmann-like domain-containing protein [Methylomagnum ishizawai]|uniref:NAD(P)-binding Rossmann-like domain-containing protein n=2 Tax=Methylomagnum ishizawai TaxID=1760988 RepID=A0A1Y6CX38_9GAMM|nr:NAD(P)-binding Rossmann-like domain-containing protein [Methylomagnum ishizawai]